MEELLDIVYYDESSPTCLRWSRDHGTQIKEGMVAGSVCSTNKYCRVHFNKRNYQVHDVVWTLFNGTIESGYIIDHKDLNRYNNMLSNLRICTHSQNMMNTKVRVTNKEGTKGLFWNEQMQRWCGTVTVQGNRRRFKSKDKQAVMEWLLKTREELHKEFCNHG